MRPLGQVPLFPSKPFVGYPLSSAEILRGQGTKGVIKRVDKQCVVFYNEKVL
jgi:hypothetical protein